MSSGEYDPLMGGGEDHSFEGGEGGKYELCPFGTFLGVCVAIWDIGTHMEKFKDRNEEVDRRSFIIVWELPTKKKEDGTSHFIAEKFGMFSKGYQTFSDSRNKLRVMLETWRGEKYTEAELKAGVPVRKLLHKSAQVTVKHEVDSKEVKRHRFGGITALGEGQVGPNPTVEPVIYLGPTYGPDGEFIHGGDGPPPKIDWLPYWYGKSLRDLSLSSLEQKGHNSAPAEPNTGSTPPTNEYEKSEPAAPAATPVKRRPDF